ncbi:hypothetical protein ACRAWC_01560 [Leifsonia sp. L25]|uniref:hypothetical protein n=1 Tax=Actinomycetes TaxID=1760 RepID=UPI003D688650
MTTALTFTNVGAACDAFAAGRISEDDFVTALVTLPHVEQAPPPGGSWYDGYAVVHGPVYQLLHKAYDGVIPADVYLHAVNEMLDAGHQA